MRVVFVHGVPETHRVWDHVRGRLTSYDDVALSMPGFGCSVPERFEPSMEAYADWLLAELEDQETPVHLVGHDWGGILVMRAVSLRPDLVTSWVTDAGGAADPRFAWHSLARIWQTAGEGEGSMDAQLSLRVEDRATLLARCGVPEADALVMCEGFDRTMADSILALYRSAVSVHEEWGADSRTSRHPASSSRRRPTPSLRAGEPSGRPSALVPGSPSRKTSATGGCSRTPRK